MASTSPVVLPWLLVQLVRPCQGISLDLVAGRSSIERSMTELWQEPAALDNAERSNPDDGCMDAEFGDSCYELVTWCLEHGLQEHPEWFTTFSRTTSNERNFKQIQGILHNKGKAGCGRPCSTLVQQMQRAQDAHLGGVHTTSPVQHPRRVWVATAPPTTSLEAPNADVQEAPEAEVQEAPKVEVQEAPKVEVQEAPKVEVQEAHGVEVQEAPKAEVQEAPEVEVREASKAKRADGFERLGAHVTGGDGAVPEPHVQDREVGISPGPHKQEAEEATLPKAQLGESGSPFIIDGYGRGDGQWVVSGEES